MRINLGKKKKKTTLSTIYNKNMKKDHKKERDLKINI